MVCEIDTWEEGGSRLDFLGFCGLVLIGCLRYGWGGKVDGWMDGSM